jgi:hypothetical protein
MHDDKPDRFVDDLLEASLERYRGEEPRPGLEMRILASVQTRERVARRRRLGWAVAVCAGILAAIALTLHLARVPIRQPAPSASLPPKESGSQRALLQPPLAQQPPPSFGAHSAPLQPPQQRVRRVPTRRSRPEQFPTPMPLTEQEKLLLAYVDKASKLDLVTGTNKRAEAPITDLEIPRIKIAALEIKPLDDSQSEQGK